MAAPVPLAFRIAANLDEMRRNLADAKAQVETTKSAMQRMANSLDGSSVIANANAMVKVVTDLGGASKLTEAKQQQVNRVLTEALETYAALGREAPAALQQLAQETAKVEEVTVKGASATQMFQERWAAFTAAAGTAVISIRNVIGQVQGWITASSEQENAIAKLNAALVAQGTYTPELSRQYGELASQFQRTTVHGDELTQEMQALLVQVGNVMPGQMQGALQAAMDLSAGLGVDLNTATQLVGKAFAGETGTLKRYGIVIDEAKLKAEGATAVLAAINDRMGGQAAAQAETYTGKMAILSNQFGDMKERAGELFVKAIVPLMQAFQNLPQPVQDVIMVGGLLVGVLGPLGLAFAGVGAAVATIMPVLAVALPAALSAIGVLLGPAGLVVAGIVGIVAVWKNWDAIAGFVRGVYEAVKTWMVDKFNAIVESIRAKVNAVTGFFADMYDKVVGHSYVPDMIARIGQEFGTLQGVMVGPTQAATTSVSGLFSGLLRGIVGSFSTGFSGLFGGSGGAGGALQSIVSGGLAAVGNILLPGFGSILGNLGGVVTKGLTAIGGMFRDLFSGASAEELAGRDLVAAFERNLHGMLSQTQMLEAGNESWKMTVIALRDQYIAMGLSEQQALADAKRLWESTRGGAQDAARAVDEIKRTLAGGFRVPVNFDVAPLNLPSGVTVDGPSFDSPDYAHDGGKVTPSGVVAYMAGGGFIPRGTDTVPAMLTPGERVLSVDQNKAYEQGNGAVIGAINGLRRDLKTVIPNAIGLAVRDLVLGAV